MRHLPKGWRLARLGDVATLGSGGTPKADRVDYYGGSIPWAVIGDLNDGPVTSTARTITRKGLEESSAKVVGSESVLVAMYGSIGKLGIPAMPMATNQAIAFAIPHAEHLIQRFLFWYLLSERGALTSSAKGATQQNISQTILKAWPIVLPPLDDQQLIVEAIEEQFSRLDAGSDLLRRAMYQISQAKASIRSVAAESGFGDSHRQPEGLPAGWRLVGPDDLAASVPNALTIGPFGSDLKVSDYRPAGVPLVFVRNIRARSFGGEGTKYVSVEKAASLRSHEVYRGDLLITKMGDPPGDAAIYSADSTGIVTADCIRLRPRPGADVRYLDIVFNSPTVKRQMLGITRGVAQKKVSLERFRREIKVPMPPLEEQLAIVSEVERQFSIMESLSTSIEAALHRAASLRQSLLSAAFTGRLAGLSR